MFKSFVLFCLALFYSSLFVCFCMHFTIIAKTQRECELIERERERASERASERADVRERDLDMNIWYF